MTAKSRDGCWGLDEARAWTADKVWRVWCLERLADDARALETRVLDCGLADTAGEVRLIANRLEQAARMLEDE